MQQQGMPFGEIAGLKHMQSTRRSAIINVTVLLLGAVSLGLCIIALLLDQGALSMALLTSGVAMLLLTGSAIALRWHTRWLSTRESSLFEQLLGKTENACLITQPDGTIIWSNAAAQAEFPVSEGSDITAIFADLHAEPEVIATRLQQQALDDGTAEHVVAQSDTRPRYEVTRLEADLLLWRITETEPADWRDKLPGMMVQFDAGGQLAYASPALRRLLPDHMLTRRALLFSDHPPEPGLPIPLDHLPSDIPYCALRLPAPTEAEQSYLIYSHTGAQRDHDSTTGLSETRQLQKLPVGLAQIDTDGKLCYLNDEARRLLHLRERQSALLSDLLEGLGRPVLEWIADMASGRLSGSTEIMRLTNAASETYLKVTLCKPVPGGSGHVTAVLSDVTEFKSLEAKFTQSQKMQAIGQLAGGVAHDFNNLLTAIAGHCDLLLLRHDRHDPDYPELMQIQQNANRAAALVRQLLALSRKQSLEFETVDLEETIEDAIHLLNRLVGEKITLTLHHDEDVRPIRSDKRQFEQVLMNLVVNARDALPMGGEIRIETASCNLPHGLSRPEVDLPPGEYTRIRISDDGIGIPQALLAKVFDPFFTTKRQGEGTGLGLSTVYGIVKQSGGYIFVDSEEGVGTVFTLYFTAQKEPVVEAPVAEPAAMQAAPLQSENALIMLVEDEAPVRSFAARALELQGHQVIAAESGEAALEILRDPSVRPDCFVTDVIMPGLDGPGWITQIRDRFPDTPVLFMSGYAEDSLRAAQARISHAAFLGKPFSLAEFTSTVNAQLRKRAEAA